MVRNVPDNAKRWGQTYDFAIRQKMKRGRACIFAILTTASPHCSANQRINSLNRLKSAVENITPNGGSQSMSWEQTFDFDRYGNRNFDEANTSFTGFDELCASGSALCEELRKVLNPAVNQSDNRLSSSDGYVFDNSSPHTCRQGCPPSKKASTDACPPVKPAFRSCGQECPRFFAHV